MTTVTFKVDPGKGDGSSLRYSVLANGAPVGIIVPKVKPTPVIMKNCLPIRTVEFPGYSLLDLDGDEIIWCRSQFSAEQFADDWAPREYHRIKLAEARAIANRQVVSLDSYRPVTRPCDTEPTAA